MFKVSLWTIAVVVASVTAQADRYPAGLNPALCPGYPNCDNALLALYSSGAIAPPPVHAAPAAPGAAARYPAGVPPAACPNYPFCDTGNSLGAPVQPLPGFATRQYPDGVPAAACPNYPFC